MVPEAAAWATAWWWRAMEEVVELGEEGRTT
jgi:hypothetical protein